MEFITNCDSLLINANVSSVEEKEKKVSPSLYIPNSAFR
jgi:hypothetical protein